MSECVGECVYVKMCVKKVDEYECVCVFLIVLYIIIYLPQQETVLPCPLLLC